MAKKRTIERTITTKIAIVKAFNKEANNAEERHCILPNTMLKANEKKILTYFDNENPTYKGIEVIDILDETKKYRCLETDFIDFCTEHGEVLD